MGLNWKVAWKEWKRDRKGRMDIARNLKSMGLDIAAIQKATGLLPEEIQKL